MLVFRAESYCFVLCELWKHCRAKISTQHPLRCLQIEVYVDLACFDILLNFFSMEKCQGRSAIKANLPKIITNLSPCRLLSSTLAGIELSSTASKNSSQQDETNSTSFRR